MTRLEALEAVARAARDRARAKRSLLGAICPHCGDDSCYRYDANDHLTRCARTGLVVILVESDNDLLGDRLGDALAALDQAAPQPPDVEPQPRRGSVAETAGIFDGPDSVEWLREQRAVPMIPDLLAKAYGGDR